MNDSKGIVFKNIIIVLITVIVVLWAPFWGSSSISFSNIVSGLLDESEGLIFYKIRLPRVMLAVLAGSTLALGGMVFQAIFRNNLATPFTLGVSSGASLGASIYVVYGWGFSVLGIDGGTLAAFSGALLAIFMVYGISKLSDGFSNSTMLLTGVALSMFFSSMMLFVKYMSDITSSFRILRWLMGGLGGVGYQNLIEILPLILIGTIVIFRFRNELNLLSVGEDIALSRGVDVVWVKKVLFVMTSLMVGAIVASCGPIGFVGMMVPHICRQIVGSNHKYLIYAVIFFGAMFLVICDTLARTILKQHAELPVGIITSLLGGPFFIYLLLRSK